MSLWDRALIGLGALSGVCGVALSAAAAHATGGSQIETAARFLLVHAPALIAVAALTGTGLVHPGAGRIAGIGLAVGLALFAGDLCMRGFRGAPLAPMAAPTGGILMMIGWALLAAAALFAGRS